MEPFNEFDMIKLRARILTSCLSKQWEKHVAAYQEFLLLAGSFKMRFELALTFLTFFFESQRERLYQQKFK